MNKRGHPETLQAQQFGNTNRLVHGAYAVPGRQLDPRASEIVDALMQAPHTVPLDRLAAEEIGTLILQLERIDAALSDGKVENRHGQARSLIDLRSRLSGRLESWLREFGLTPASRAEWVRQLAEGESLAESIRRRREELNGG